MRPDTVIRFAIYLFAGLLLLGSAGLATGFFFVVKSGNEPEHGHRFNLRVPVERRITLAPYVPVEGTLTLGAGTPSQLSGNWSQFRGENRDAISPETTPLRKNWSEEQPPPVLWELPLGEGYAGFAVRNGRVYILDYDMENQRDALRCLSLDDGQEIWRFSYPVQIKKNHGMSRTIPVVTDQYCVSLGPKCHVLCVDAVTGEEKWFIDLRHEYGTVEPQWYAGQCPLITVLPGSDKPSVIIAPSGPEVMVVAHDCETGEEVWRTPNPHGWEMTHASLAPMMLDGQLTFVYFGGEGVAGVRADDGKILWSKTGLSVGLASCPSPVIVPDNRIFLCGGYKVGSTMLQIVPDSPGTYKANTLFQLPDAVFDSEQQTPIFYEGHIFGLRQYDKQFVCLDLNGKVVWESGRTEKFGSGPYIIVDGMILILDDDGTLTGCEAAFAGYRKLFAVEDMFAGGACWAPMAIVQGRLLLRDQMSMKCIDIRE